MPKTKVCAKCNKRKPISHFNKKGEGTNARCRSCLGEYYREAYKTKPERRKQVVRAVAKRRKAIGKFLDELKDGQPCKDCGRTFPPCAMDYDHVEGEKVGNVSALARRNGWSEDRLLEEIAKCDLVCAVCHRIRTHNPR